MGSDSDLPVMKEAARILNMFSVPYEVIPSGMLLLLIEDIYMYVYICLYVLAPLTFNL